jgi:TetR/AcrR family transcriptional repressor of nem operon
MPRVSRAQADLNRTAITQASSRLFRERGFRGVSVAELMGAAGLTHGGFYGHFDSKDALAAEAAEWAFAQSTERWRKRTAAQPTPSAGRTALVENYLRASNVPDAANGCPTAALCVDVGREPADAPVRAMYRAGLEDMLEVLAAAQATGDAAADRRAALADYATMLGALLIARATSGSPLADEVLAAARDRLLPDPTTKSSRRAAPDPRRGAPTPSSKGS